MPRDNKFKYVLTPSVCAHHLANYYNNDSVMTTRQECVRRVYYTCTVVDNETASFWEIFCLKNAHATDFSFFPLTVGRTEKRPATKKYILKTRRHGQSQTLPCSWHNGNDIIYFGGQRVPSPLFRRLTKCPQVSKPVKRRNYTHNISAIIRTF